MPETSINLFYKFCFRWILIAGHRSNLHHWSTGPLITFVVAGWQPQPTLHHFGLVHAGRRSREASALQQGPARTPTNKITRKKKSMYNHERMATLIACAYRPHGVPGQIPGLGSQFSTLYYMHSYYYIRTRTSNSIYFIIYTADTTHITQCSMQSYRFRWMCMIHCSVLRFRVPVGFKTQPHSHTIFVFQLVFSITNGWRHFRRKRAFIIHWITYS